MTGSSSEQSSSVYDFTVKVIFIFILIHFEFISLRYPEAIVLNFTQDIRGNDVDLSIYKGKVLLIVNVASQW
jgi:hypothetical protein